MEWVNASEVIQQAESESSKRLNDARQALDWFLDRQGEMFEMSAAAAEISEELSMSEERALRAIMELTGDIVDPVQHVIIDGVKRVGIGEYHVWEDAGAYGYIQFHDLYGERKRVVCAKCAHDKTLDANVTHATEGEGSLSKSESWATLLDMVTIHYANEHEEAPYTIEPGASLVSGSTIAGNTVFYSGNDGSGSGLAADTIDTYHLVEDGTDDTGVINLKLPSVATATVTSTISGMSVEMTFFEDSNSDGTVDNQQTVTLSGGTESFDLNQLSDNLSGDVWWRTDSSGSVTNSSGIQTVEIQS